MAFNLAEKSGLDFVGPHADPRIMGSLELTSGTFSQIPPPQSFV